MKSNSLKRRSKWILILLAFVPQYYISALTIDIRGVNFNENMPSISDGLTNSVVDGDDSIAILRNDLDFILSYKSKLKNDRFRIVGFTDNRECHGDACLRLALRRAQFVYLWFAQHGVTAQQLLPPEGCGSQDPVATNDTLDGRARNRRAEVQYISSPKSPDWIEGFSNNYQPRLPCLSL